VRLKLMQVCTVGMGIAIYFWASFYHFPESVFRYLTLTGSISFAATLTTLVGGIYWKRASVRGAYCAFVGSTVFPAICLAWPSFSPTLAGLLSFTLAPLGMIAGSLLFPNTKLPQGVCDLLADRAVVGTSRLRIGEAK
jgi:SSS family solute:Na+ symporter